MGIEDSRENEEKLFAELKGIVDSAMAGPAAEEVYTRFAEFVDELKKQHPDIHDYRLFHLLAGSSIQPEHEPKFDLPSGEIETFIRSLKKQA